MTVNPYVRIARHAALKETGALVESLRDVGGDPSDAFETLRRHGLIGLILSVLTERDLHGALPSALAHQLESWRARPRASPEMLLQSFARARDALEANDIAVLLLKGFHLAERLYGGLVYRPQFDVDVLVRERDFRPAVRALVKIGFSRESYDLHATTLTREGAKLDMHRCLRRAPAFRIEERADWDSAIDACAGGVSYRTLSDERTLVLLILGAFEDTGQGMVKIRQLLDTYLLVRAIDAQHTWDDFFTNRDAENLSGVCVNVLSLVMKLFEARTDAPHLERALSARADRCEPATCAEALPLVFAPRKRLENLEWFGRVYPGSLTHYLAWFWYGGFPNNIKEIGSGRVTASLRAVFKARSGTAGRT